MIPLGLLFLLAATRVELLDEAFPVPAGEWRYVEIPLKQRTANIECSFEARRAPVRMLLLGRADLPRFRARRRVAALVETKVAGAGSFRYQPRRPGDFVIVLDNRGLPDHNPVSSDVRLRVTVDFAPAVSYLPPTRQLAVILISFAAFFAILLYSARKLLPNMRR